MSDWILIGLKMPEDACACLTGVLRRVRRSARFVD
jgi:hypothetical protein